MYWQKKRIHTKSSVDAGTTYRYRLPEVGLYSAFSVRCEARRYADRTLNAASQHLFEAITKVELLYDGTSVVKSLRGGELLALNCFDFGKIPPYQHREQSERYNIVTFYLLAGRSLQDKDHVFDMSRLGAPTLEITNDLSEAAADYWKADSLEYQVFGWRAVGTPQPRPRGFFRCNERVYYTTSAEDAEKAIEITPGKLIRRVLLKGWTQAQTFGGHIKKVELEIDEGAYSPVVIDNMFEWMKQNALDYKLDLAHSDRVYSPEAGGSCMFDSFISYGCYPSVTAFFNAQTATRVFGVTGGLINIVPGSIGGQYVGINGVGYQKALLIGFDKDPDLADMFDARGLGKIKLILTENAASRVISVCVEELVTY